MEWAASAANVTPRWRFLGLAQGFLGLLMAAVAALFAVWCFDRAMVIHSGAMASGSPAEVASNFVSAMNDRAGQFTKALIGLAAAGALSALGIRLGMGILGWIVLPGVAITLLGVLEFVALRIDLQPVTAFLFFYDGSQWSVEAAKQALLSAGVTLGAGLGVAMALGAQAPRNLPLARSVIAVAILDTAFLFVTAIIASALLFEVNVAPSEGLTAVFVALPYAFVNVPMGELYGTLFFFAMAAISWSAALILMEPTVLLLEQAVGRLGAAILAATLAVLLASMLLFTADTALAQVSVIVGEWLLPLSLLATALFVGWRLPRPILRGELYRLWWWVLRWMVPPVCVAWLISGVV
jgi:NSS family neurotransmitter:Na+ symporter